MIIGTMLIGYYTHCVVSPPKVLTEREFRTTVQLAADALDYRLTESGIISLVKLVESESNFRPWVYNGGKPHRVRGGSSAFGMFQCLKGTYSNYGYSEYYGVSSPFIQCKLGLEYILDRYGSPEKAWEFKKRRGYY